MVATTALVGTWFITTLTRFHYLDQLALDFCINHGNDIPPSKQVYIVDFDEESISRFGNPVSRNVLATLIPKVGAAQPKIIGLNMLLDRPTNQVDDETLVDALTKAGVVIASSGSSAKQMPLRTSYQPE